MADDNIFFEEMGKVVKANPKPVAAHPATPPPARTQKTAPTQPTAASTAVAKALPPVETPASAPTAASTAVAKALPSVETPASAPTAASTTVAKALPPVETPASAPNPSPQVYQSLLEELQEKCKPNLFYNDPEKFKVSNEIYAVLRDPHSDIERNSSEQRMLRKRAEEELGVVFDTTRLRSLLERELNPDQFIGAENYDKELVQVAYELNEKLKKCKTVSELEELGEAVRNSKVWEHKVKMREREKKIRERIIEAQRKRMEEWMKRDMEEKRKREEEEKKREEEKRAREQAYERRVAEFKRLDEIKRLEDTLAALEKKKSNVILLEILYWIVSVCFPLFVPSYLIIIWFIHGSDWDKFLGLCITCILVGFLGFMFTKAIIEAITEEPYPKWLDQKKSCIDRLKELGVSIDKL